MKKLLAVLATTALVSITSCNSDGKNEVAETSSKSIETTKEDIIVRLGKLNKFIADYDACSKLKKELTAKAYADCFRNVDSTYGFDTTTEQARYGYREIELMKKCEDTSPYEAGSINEDNYFKDCFANTNKQLRKEFPSQH
jgi:hypothetical protein